MTTPATRAHPGLLAHAELDWQDGTPASRALGDVYFSRQDGVAETDAVFIDGSDLRSRLRACRRGQGFRIAETGFGTGLNFLRARQVFLACAPADCLLDFVSVERAPVASADLLHCAAMLAAAGHPEVAADMRRLAAVAPPPVAGWHRVLLDAGRVRLSLWFGDGPAGLDDWLAQRRPGDPGVDAWFLDGFAPRLDSGDDGLWSAALAPRLAALSAPDATVATFSVARRVREMLATAGFEITLVPGTTASGPGKRQILRGRMRRPAGPLHALAGDPVEGDPVEGDPVEGDPIADDPVLVLGAGLAGACTAAALARRGRRVLVCDARGPAAGASGNPWAVLHPRLPLDDGPRALWLLAAERFALTLLDDLLAKHGAEAGWTPAPVLQAPEARRPERLARVAERFPGLPDLLAPLRLDDRLLLQQTHGGHADLPRLIARLLDAPGIELHTPMRIRALEATAAGWRAVTDRAPGHGEALPVCRTLIVAAGAALPTLLPGLPVGRMRGQVTRTRGPDASLDARLPAGAILTGRGHAVPLADGWVCGSSYVRDGPEGPPTAQERAANRGRLSGWLAWLGDPDAAGRVADAEVIGEFTGVRATLPDRVPLVGMLQDGLWVNAGHASSGLVTCPLAGEALAARLAGEPPVLDRAVSALLDPRRFDTGRA